ncbi:MAG: aspartate aminotransferase family protein [Phycisphaerales bacterium]|nr:aspartate aminotransferase family protein [Phycisphaerales bacterium]
MSRDEFRRLGHRFIDWIADYWQQVDLLPVMSQAKPGDLLSRLPEHAPADGMDAAGWDGVFGELDRLIVPGLTNWQSPNFYAYVPSNVSGPGVLGELLSAGLGVQGMLWQTSPACTELEIRVLDWMGGAVGLPEVFLSGRKGQIGKGQRAHQEEPAQRGGGVIQGTASEAALVAMIAAKRRVGARARGTQLVAYASEQAHSSILKAGIICGVCLDASDREGLRLVPTGPEHAIDVGELDRMMREDLARGRVPFFVCASVGTTGSTAVDSISGVAGAIRAVEEVDTGRMPVPRDGVGEGSIWLHVDAAHAGAACICPEFRWMIDGIAEADSFCFNPHKWLLTNFDCNCFWVRDHRAIVDAMSVTPEYLRNAASESGEVVDFRDWQVPLGRRFRSLKLWLVMRHYGIEGLRAHIREHVRLASLFEELVKGDDRFETCAPRTVNLVCFRLRPLAGESAAATDARNRELMNRLNASGRLYLTHTSLPVWQDGARAVGESMVVLRMAIGAVRTTEKHVRQAWNAICDSER